MRPQGKNGRFLSDDEHRLNEGLARGILIEDSPHSRCRVGKIRLKTQTQPPCPAPAANKPGWSPGGDRPYEPMDEPEYNEKAPPDIEAAIINLLPKIRDRAPPRPEPQKPTRPMAVEPKGRGPSPARSTSNWIGKTASHIAWGLIIACAAFWIPFLVSLGFGLGIQTYLAKGFPFLAAQFDRDDR
jgi:hypothetical protein